MTTDAIFAVALLTIVGIYAIYWWEARLSRRPPGRHLGTTRTGRDSGEESQPVAGAANLRG